MSTDWGGELRPGRCLGAANVRLGHPEEHVSIFKRIMNRIVGTSSEAIEQPPVEEAKQQI